MEILHQNNLKMDYLVKKMEKEQKFRAQKIRVNNIRSFPIFPLPISEY